MPKGKPYSAEFKARLVLEALQGAKTVGEIAAEHSLNPNLVRNWKAKAERFRSTVLSWDLDYTTCAYDPRDVAPFVATQTTLDEINRTWPVRYRSFFDVSFTAESKIPLGHASWKPPRDDPKYVMWRAVTAAGKAIVARRKRRIFSVPRRRKRERA